MSSDSPPTSFLGNLWMWPVGGAACVGLFLIFLYSIQDRLLYHPVIPGMSKTPDENPDGFRNPKEHWNVPYENHMIPTSDGEKIHAWLMLQPNSASKPTVIYFHGNAGNMGFRLPNMTEMFKKCGVNVLSMDYRGYGSSTGTPSEKGINLDANAVIEFALKHPALTNSKIILFGRSLGGAVSFALAERYSAQVSGIIVENTFTSISDMVDVVLPLVASAKHLVMAINWNSLDIVKKLKNAMLFISGDSDELVPPKLMKSLFDNATNSVYKDLYTVNGGGHNDTWVKAREKWYERIREFIYNSKTTGQQSHVTSKQCDTDASIDESKTYIPTMGTNFQVK